MRISDWSSDVCSSDLIAIDHALCARENLRCIPVVRFQARNLTVGPLGFEIDDIGAVGASPGEDELVIVAQEENIVLALRKEAQKTILTLIGVLIFVDHDGDRKSTRLNSSH